MLTLVGLTACVAEGEPACGATDSVLVVLSERPQNEP
jgi:hypothetical protein